MGSEDKIGNMTHGAVQRRTPACSPWPTRWCFIGLLIGGAVPLLFSSMLIRAVGRAAFYIIKECRIQFRDKEIMGRHEEARLRPRGRHLHQHRPGRIDRPRPAGHPRARSWSASCWAPTPWAASWPA